MSKDDYYVIAYRILAYLYACLKCGEKPSAGYLVYETDDFPIGKDYWYYILTHLYKGGFIEGVEFVSVLGNDQKMLNISEHLTITPAGIDYLQNNCAMKRAFDFLKSLKEIIPGV